MNDLDISSKSPAVHILKGGKIMIQVSNVNKNTGNTAQPVREPVDAAADSVSKDIQSKIMVAQKQRQGLSFNTEMTSEEKENIRRKIQQEISDLKRELRQREAEEKRKQQEEERAVERKKEQQEHAAQEAARKQQRNQLAQGTAGQQQDTQAAQGSNGQRQKNQPIQSTKGQQNPKTAQNTEPQQGAPGPGRSNGADASRADGEVREILPGGFHKIISSYSAVNQFHTVRNAAAQLEGTARIREAETNLDAVRGADVKVTKKEQRETLQKETKRMETVQNFMFGDSQKAAEPTVGIRRHYTRGANGNGLYGRNGMLFKTNFQSIQMDLKQ